MTKLEKVMKAFEICNDTNGSCYDCPFYLQDRETIDDALELIKERLWISVNDRLPEVDKSVIVFARGKNNPIYKIAIASMSNKNVFDVRLETELYWREPWQFFNTNYEITHWMPLPEPPKEEGEL